MSNGGGGFEHGLVRWLVEGLAHDLLPRERQLQQALIGEETPLDVAIGAAVRPQGERERDSAMELEPFTPE